MCPVLLPIRNKLNHYFTSFNSVTSLKGTPSELKRNVELRKDSSLKGVMYFGLNQVDPRPCSVYRRPCVNRFIIIPR